jgi:hypothetical protein
MQEQETYLNIATRLITTRGVQQLTPFERSGQSSEVIRDLPRLIQPSAIASAYVPDTDKVAMTLEQMRSLKAALDEKKAELDVIIEESNQQAASAAQVQEAQQDVAEASASVAAAAAIPVALVPVQGTAPLAPIPLRQDVPNQVISENQVMFPQQPQAQPQEQMGGLMVPGGQPTYVGGSSMGPIIVVDTGGARMQQELGGLQGLGGMGGMGRAPRRNPFRRSMNYGGDMGGMDSMGSMGSFDSMENASSPSVNVRVNKMG